MIIYFEFLRLRREVGLDVELREEDEEHDGVGTDEVGKLPRKTTLFVKDLKIIISF
jgi:hypothetical protein